MQSSFETDVQLIHTESRSNFDNINSVTSVYSYEVYI